MHTFYVVLQLLPRDINLTAFITLMVLDPFMNHLYVRSIGYH